MLKLKNKWLRYKMKVQTPNYFKAMTLDRPSTLHTTQSFFGDTIEAIRAMVTIP